jgi:hypothetical protein
VQASGFERGLGRDALRCEHVKTGRWSVPQERRLAGPEAAGDHQGGSLAGPGGCQLFLHRGALLVTPAEYELGSHTDQ